MLEHSIGSLPPFTQLRTISTPAGTFTHTVLLLVPTLPGPSSIESKLSNLHEKNGSVGPGQSSLPNQHSRLVMTGAVSPTKGKGRLVVSVV